MSRRSRPPQATDAPSRPAPQRTQGAPTGGRFRPSKYQVVIAAFITTVGGGVFLLIAGGGDPPPPPPPQACSFPAVQISAPEKAGSTFQTTAKVNCPPPKGTKYYLIAQLDNVGEPGTEHTVFCPSDPITPGQEAKTYTTTRDIDDSELHSKRSLSYLKVTTDQEQELLANLHDTCAWKLPAGVETISNSATVEHAWR